MRRCYESRGEDMSLIAYVTQIQFGPGVLSTLREECARVGIRRPLIVTDRGVRASGIVDKVLALSLIHI